LGRAPADACWPQGKVAQENLREYQMPQYGAPTAMDHVPGAEYLQALQELERDAERSATGAGRGPAARGLAAEDGAEGEGADEGDGWETASDDDDDDDDDGGGGGGGEWVTVLHSSDEDEDKGAAAADPTTAALLRAGQLKRRPDDLLETQRVWGGGGHRATQGPVRADGAWAGAQILTPADFVAIKKLQQQADLAKVALTKGQKRRLEAASAPADDADAGECVRAPFCAPGGA
jgi:hypothetical protein